MNQTPTKLGRPAILSVLIRQALCAHDGPVGMTHIELVNATRIKSHTVSAVAYKMLVAGIAFALGTRRDVRYFPSAEARNAAAEGYAEYMEQVRESRRLARVAKGRAASQRHTESKRAARQATALPHMVRWSPTRLAIVGALNASASPIGMSRAEIVAVTGLVPDVVTNTLYNMRKDGTAFQIGAKIDMRYFATAEALEAAQIPYKQWLFSLKQERIERDKQTARRSARKAEATKAEQRRAERIAAGLVVKPRPEPKVKAMPKPKHIQKSLTISANVTIANRSRAWWPKDAPEHRPAHVKVTVCPNRLGERYRTQTFEDFAL
jgi:hypothetical protein